MADNLDIAKHNIANLTSGLNTERAENKTLADNLDIAKHNIANLTSELNTERAEKKSLMTEVRDANWVVLQTWLDNFTEEIAPVNFTNVKISLPSAVEGYLASFCTYVKDLVDNNEYRRISDLLGSPEIGALIGDVFNAIKDAAVALQPSVVEAAKTKTGKVTNYDDVVKYNADLAEWTKQSDLLKEMKLQAQDLQDNFVTVKNQAKKVKDLNDELSKV